MFTQPIRRFPLCAEILGIDFLKQRSFVPFRQCASLRAARA
jgi:hypothetical protein